MQGLTGQWQGWLIDTEGYLCDPAGNKYLPTDLSCAFWARQTWEARAGYPGEVAFLRERLAELIRHAEPPTIVVEVKRRTHDGDIVLQTLAVS